MKIGVVADDITGANDIGIMFAKSQYVTYIYPFDETYKKDHEQNPDVLIFDTNSRFDEGDMAYNKVYRATKSLVKEGYQQFYNKTCSVFRGNIGREFDAMLDALDEDFAVVVLGFPKNSRTTKNGIHYVHGKPLEESEFKNDPMHPMNESDLVSILQKQTKRMVKHVDFNLVRAGAKILKNYIQDMKEKCQYLILDVENQESLKVIAEAVKDEKIICGSSALAEELPSMWGTKNQDDEKCQLPPMINKGIFCIAGSLMPQTTQQINFLKEKGIKTMEMNTLVLFDSLNKQKMLEDLIYNCVNEIKKGKDVLVHSSNSEDIVRKTKEQGAKFNFSKTEVSRLVSTSLSEIVLGVMKRVSINRLIIAGGDTSATICDRLEVNGLRVWKEIQPGLPSCMTLSKEPLLLVLKSGSFGKEDFIYEAITHLKKEVN